MPNEKNPQNDIKNTCPKCLMPTFPIRKCKCGGSGSGGGAGGSGRGSDKKESGDLGSAKQGDKTLGSQTDQLSSAPILDLKKDAPALKPMINPFDKAQIEKLLQLLNLGVISLHLNNDLGTLTLKWNPKLVANLDKESLAAFEWYQTFLKRELQHLKNLNPQLAHKINFLDTKNSLTLALPLSLFAKFIQHLTELNLLLNANSLQRHDEQNAPVTKDVDKEHRHKLPTPLKVRPTPKGLE